MGKLFFYKESGLSYFLFLIVFLYLFNFFTPDLSASGGIFDEQIGSASSGLNGRSLFWLIFVVIVSFPILYRPIFLLQKNNFTSFLFFSSLLAFFSICWSVYPNISIIRSSLLLISCVSCSILYYRIHSLSLIREAFLSISVLLLLINFYFLILYPNIAIQIGGSLKGIYTTKNNLGAISAIQFLICFSFLLNSNFNKNRTKLIYYGASLVWFIYLVLSQSKSSIAIALFITTLMLLRKKLCGFCLYIILGVLIVLVALPIIFRISGVDIFLIYLDFLEPELLTGRGEIWMYMLSEFGSYFWQGVGYGAYWSTGDVREIFDIKHSFFTLLNSSHNSFLHLITNVGVLGLLLYLMLIFYKLLKNRSRLECYESAIILFILLHSFFETDLFVYKYTTVLVCCIFTRLDYQVLGGKFESRNK